MKYLPLKLYCPSLGKRELLTKDDIFLAQVQKEDEMNHPFVEETLPEYVKTKSPDRRKIKEIIGFLKP